MDYIEKNSFSFPIVVIKNNENLGFAPAVNQGILKSKYDYILNYNDVFIINELLTNTTNSNKKAFAIANTNPGSLKNPKN